MTVNAKDLPVYILLGIVVFFITWAAISTRKGEKKDREKQDRGQNKNKENK